MTYEDYGFRELYHSFAAIVLTDELRPSIKDFPDEEDANCAITYGYIDHEAGFTFEVLSAAKVEDDGQIHGDMLGNEDIRSFIRADAVGDCEVILLEDPIGLIAKLHEKKLEIIEAYDPSEELAETREMDFLDEWRHPYCVDDIPVMIRKEGLQPEVCWARLEGRTENAIKGTLLNEPNQAFGCHEQDLLFINIHEADDGKLILYSDID